MFGVNQHNRTAAAEEDGTDQIGVDSPRSGIATPQPDLHDRRLPGIMSYFNQVRASSFQRLLVGTFKTSGTTTPSDEGQLQAAAPTELPPTPNEPDSRPGCLDKGPPLLAHEKLGPATETSPQEGAQMHPWPSPPVSQPASLRNFPGDSSSQKPKETTPPVSRPPSLRHLSISDFGRGKTRRQSLLALPATTVNESSVSAHHLSNPAEQSSTVPNSPSRTRSTSGSGGLSFESASVVNLRKLTTRKSGTSTPNRALSTAHPSSSDGQEDARQRNGERINRTASNTPAPQGAQAPAARGKLTIKITEARGLRKCRDPYVVVVFQRSELISAGPRPAENDDEAAIAAVASGGIPIQRQGSDSGRAIPMRSRQSSNSSLSDFSTFRSRNGRRSLTSPKWDAEAIL